MKALLSFILSRSPALNNLMCGPWEASFAAATSQVKIMKSQENYEIHKSSSFFNFHSASFEVQNVVPRKTGNN